MLMKRPVSFWAPKEVRLQREVGHSLDSLGKQIPTLDAILHVILPQLQLFCLPLPGILLGLFIASSH